MKFRDAIASVAAGLLVLAAMALGPLLEYGYGSPQAPKQDRPLVIMTMGDSITYGEGGRSGDSYRAELDRLLSEAGVPHEFVVEAVGGVSCGYWAPRAFELVRDAKPDIVLLNCGTNDPGGQQTQSDYYWLLTNLLSGNGWSTRVIPAFPTYAAVPPAAGWLQGSLPRVNDAIYRVLFVDVPWWIQAGRIPAIADLQVIPPAYLDTGGVHPTSAGYVASGRIWYNALRKAYPELLPDIAPRTCGLTGHRVEYPLPPYTPCTELAPA